jgi:hypothetical protein
MLRQTSNLTVRLLVASASAGTTVLLGLTTAAVSNKEAAVVRDKEVLDLLLGDLVNVLLVESNDGLGKSLADGCKEERGNL